jgi:quercetin dioxygenase-like cupin family protein
MPAVSPDHDAASDVGPRLRELGLDASSWGNGPGERYAAHEHGYDKVIAVERGTIQFGLPVRGETIALVPGDRLDLPAGTIHDALVGPTGVSCLEAHLPVGSLEDVTRRSSGAW